MARFGRDPHFSFMLIGLLIALVAGPALLEMQLRRSGLLVQAIFSITLIISVWTAVESRRWFAMGIILVLITATTTVMQYFRPSLITVAIGLIGILSFCVFSIAFTVDSLFKSGSYKVSPNRLIGAISVYLLLGIGFGILNMLIELFLPGSYKGMVPTDDPGASIDMIYFSFVTMTTLGYGDVTPTKPLAQAIAYITAITGQFYIAMLVSALVGAYISQQMTARKPE